MQKTKRQIKKQSLRALTPSQRLRSRSANFFGNAIMFLYSITCIYPVIWLLYSSMKTQAEFSANSIALPKAPSLRHYHDVLFETDMFLWLGNTTRNTVCSLVLILFLGFVIGYFLSRFNFRGRKFLYGFFMLGILVPVHALMVPMYIEFNTLNLDNEWFTLIFPYVSFGLPIAIFLVESALRGIPLDIEEAAAIDGASFTRTLLSIMLPMCMPVLVTIGIIQFFTCWNEFAFSLILISKDKLKTVPVGLTMFKGQYSMDYPKMMTAMVVAMLPAMILYFSFSGQIIKGMVAGAVKG